MRSGCRTHRAERIGNAMGTRTDLSAATICSNPMLLERAAQGEQSAWKELVNKYDGFVRSVAGSFRLQAADVHDVAQATWLRLVQHLHTIRDPERLAGWLAITATRESLNVIRKASRQDPVAMVDETPDPDPAVDAEASAENRDAARHLWATVAELSPRQRSLLIAMFRDELDSYHDVAAKCAMPIGSIGPTRARALSHLQRRLAERGLGPGDL
jgi:RNA polymerase sigma factor (sigma-70 family)